MIVSFSGGLVIRSSHSRLAEGGNGLVSDEERQVEVSFLRLNEWIP